MDPDDPIAFAEKVLALLRQGAFTATYKYAVLIGLIDLALEGYTASGMPPEAVTTHQLAEAVIRLYWPQVAPFEESGLLRQNTRGNAEIVTMVAAARARFGGLSLARARRQVPAAYDRLVDDVAWKLAEMPLPRLQRFGRQEERFIYEIGWAEDIKRSAFKDPACFDNAIRFRPGVAHNLVRLDGLLRPLLHREWAMLVAQINALPAARLTDHLFGVDRASLAPVLPGLLDLQHGRCFYCDKGVSSAEVDHFLPWARIALDTIENLVVAHPACNNKKTDHLAAAEHLARWRERIASAHAQLEAVANDALWETSAPRTLGVARALYLPLRPDARVWSYESGLVPVDANQIRALLAA